MISAIDLAALVKVDIEGNEFDVFINFPFEKYHVQNILIEHNYRSKHSYEQMISFFNQKNFKCYSVNGIELQTSNQDIPDSNIWLVNQYLKKN